MLALQALRPDALASVVPGLTAAEARKIVAAVHRSAGLPDNVPQVRRTSQNSVRAAGAIPTLETVARHESALDPFVKLGFATRDGHRIETVRIPLERTGRYSVCVSSQAGCALACTFCATGRLGLSRNLETWEIVEQVRQVHLDLLAAGAKRNLRARVHGVVFQGMGEPLSNIDHVLEAIGVMTDPSALAIDARAITVCTAGLPAGIRRLARDAPRVRLGLSLGSAFSATRRQLMPITNAHPLDEVIDAVADHARTTGLSPLWAITLLEGVNDSKAHAQALCELALRFRARTGVRPRLSVIPYNRIADDDRDPFRRSSDERERAFRAVFHDAGVPTHKRYSGGSDVAAACGQLAAR